MLETALAGAVRSESGLTGWEGRDVSEAGRAYIGCRSGSKNGRRASPGRKST